MVSTSTWKRNATRTDEVSATETVTGSDVSTTIRIVRIQMETGIPASSVRLDHAIIINVMQTETATDWSANHSIRHPLRPIAIHQTICSAVNNDCNSNSLRFVYDYNTHTIIFYLLFFHFLFFFVFVSHKAESTKNFRNRDLVCPSSQFSKCAL